MTFGKMQRAYNGAVVVVGAEMVSRWTSLGIAPIDMISKIRRNNCDLRWIESSQMLKSS
jgi:hypothetical protein